MPPEAREATLSPQQVDSVISRSERQRRRPGSDPRARPPDRRRGRAPRLTRCVGHGRPPSSRPRGAIRRRGRRHRRPASRGSPRARRPGVLHAPGGGDRACPGSPKRRHHDADGVRQDTLLQRACPELGACAIRPTRALYLFPTKALAQDQLAELHAPLGSTLASKRSRDRCLHVRRRYAAGRAGARSEDARTSCSATPTWSIRGSCRITLAGRSCSRICSSSSSTSCMRIAACSAVT